MASGEGLREAVGEVVQPGSGGGWGPAMRRRRTKREIGSRCGQPLHQGREVRQREREREVIGKEEPVTDEMTPRHDRNLQV